MRVAWGLLLAGMLACSSSSSGVADAGDPLNPNGHTCSGGATFCDGQDAEAYCQCMGSQCCFIVSTGDPEQCCNIVDAGQD